MSGKIALKAHQLVNQAVAAGQLTRPNACELCARPDGSYYHGIVGHHYLGYEGANALKVWFVCLVCNAILRGHHDGSLTKEQAKQVVQENLSARLPVP